jgi:hypothetical protein
MEESFQNYFTLLGAIRQLAFDHDGWDSGPAKAMLDFHSGKLLQIRRHALSRKLLVLKTYIYLRDAAAKSFYHESMTESLWARISELSAPGDDEDAPNFSSMRCAHCRSATIHKSLNLEPYKRNCFFKDLTQTLARKAASEALAKHKDRPNETLREICFVILGAYKEE